MGTAGFSDRELENLIREGITAARGGKKVLAHRLLMRAARLAPTDARVWLWLSGTTNDAVAQRDYLEKAIAADPSNAAAKRGLAILAGQEGASVSDLPHQAHEDAYIPPKESAIDPEATLTGSTATFSCPKCGGRMRHLAHSHELTCEYCGFSIETNTDIAADSSEMPFSKVLQSEKAHLWAASVHEIECEQCGSHTMEPPGTKTQSCPFCGSNQLVESEQLNELLDPQAIGLFEIDEGKALNLAKEWLNRGFFTPDNLADKSHSFEIRPAYYPFWTFDGSVEFRWTAQVRENYGRSSLQQPDWQTMTGMEVEFFDDVLVPGFAALGSDEVQQIYPFKLKEVLRFEPSHLAGWLALAYDLPISDASLVAREKIVQRARPILRKKIAPGREKREVSIGAGNWSGLTYKHVLLPLWVGTFSYDQKIYRMIINGQTGKVSGQKPSDKYLVYGVWALGFLSAVILIYLFVWAWINWFS